MTKKKLLIISDSISCTSGLGRIARDQAVRIHKHLGDVIDVATVGYGGPGSSKFGFPEYHMHDIQDWLVQELPLIANDFAPDEELILMPIWDLSRLYWMANPAMCPTPHLRRWLETAKYKKWLYHPIDAEGPNGQLPGKLRQIMGAFDRVLDYSEFSSNITMNADHLPHGIDTKDFYLRDRLESKRAFRNFGFRTLKDKSLLIGIVATNQARKDWALGMQTCRILLDRGHDLRVWCHVDAMERYWNIPDLVMDYGLQERVAITQSNFTDDQMNGLYAACDVTLAPSSEGFGYPIYESLASGTPCIHFDYAGGAEWLPVSMKVKPIAYRYEGTFCMKRPVGDPEDWANVVEENIGITASLPNELDWKNLWPRWEEWYRKGIE